MNCFQDLSKSNKFDDQLVHHVFITLLKSIFQKHDNIIIDTNCETDENQLFIKTHAKLLANYFGIHKRVFSTQKCVRQTIKHMIEYLNTQYKFQNPIQMIHEKKSQRDGDKVISICHTTLKFL